MPAASNAEEKARRCESVSTVEPDFEDTTSTVRERSVPIASAIWPESVVSTTSRGTPAVAQMTSGASEEPPMPASVTMSTPSARSSARSSAISASRPVELVGRSTQPSRREASGAAASPHRVPSPTLIREATWAVTRSRTSSSNSAGEG